LNVEKKVREETENMMFRMLEDINARLQNDISNERNTRERSEEQMLRLLEETCGRIESSLR